LVALDLREESFDRLMAHHFDPVAIAAHQVMVRLIAGDLIKHLPPDLGCHHHSHLAHRKSRLRYTVARFTAGILADTSRKISLGVT
jgi:hypothetical protein